jgi:hypothetical protein
MSNSENEIECGTHGTRTVTFVCNHLVHGEKLGFNCGYGEDEPDAIYPDAWCDECEKVLNIEGEWNDKSESFADIKIVCSSCYEDLRERNWIQDNEEFREFICEGLRYLEEKQSKFIEKFKINDYERWDWDQETGKLVFSHEGVQKVEAEICFCGSISKKSDTWMWAWANEYFLEPVKASSRDVRTLGERYRYLKLASALWHASEEDGWEMTAIMAKELNAIGAYRTPSDTGFSYMVIKNAKWLNNNINDIFSRVVKK